MTHIDMLRIAAFERLAVDPLAQELLHDLIETVYQQGRLDGINELARRLGASDPKPDDVPAPCADGFRGGQA